MNEGRLIRGRGGLYTVRTEEGQEHVLRAKKKFRREGLSPLVGDRVLFTPGTVSDEHGWIEQILPRTNHFKRPPVANITLLCITVAPVPEADLLLVDKLLVFAARQQMKALLVAAKEELDGGKTALELRQAYRLAGTEVFPVSSVTGEGLEALKERLKGEYACFSGQSGVGKSTLLNALFSIKAETGEISEKIARGKNTTRHTELFSVDGCYVFDTPGFSLLDLDLGEDPKRLQDWYPDFSGLRDECRFDGCCHDAEPGCAVRRDVGAGRIDPGRYDRYRELLNQCREKWKNRYQ